MIMTFSCAEPKPIITKDGKKVGALAGGTVDTNRWAVTLLALQVDKEAVPLLGKKKPALKPLVVNFRTDIVGAIGDVVQLNVDLNGLKDHLHGLP
jgi:sporulation protein YlmC with PRC-barrel domain